MEFKNVSSFHETTLDQKKINSSFWKKSNELSNESKLKKFIKKGVAPKKEEVSYDFYTEKLFSYERKLIQRFSKQRLRNMGLSHMASIALTGIFCVLSGSISYAMNSVYSKVEENRSINDLSNIEQTYKFLELETGHLCFYTDEDSICLECFTNMTAEIDMNTVISHFGTSTNKFKIGFGIKSILLKGNEEIDIAEACSLERIDVTNSTKYKTEYVNGTNIVKLCTQEGKLIDFIFPKDPIENIKYTKSHQGSIKLTMISQNHLDMNSIPQELRIVKRKFDIGKGIKSITLQSDDEVDISQADDLERIDASRSNKYIVDDESLALYQKNGDKKGDLVSIKEEGTINNINYDNSSNWYIRLTGSSENPINIDTIPQVLKDARKKFQNEKKFQIREGIKSIKLQGDDEVDISQAKDLESIDTYKSDKYIVDSESLALYHKIGNIKGDLASIKEKGTINNINYDNSSDWCVLLTGNPKFPIDIETIPQALRDLKKSFTIGEGIKTIALQDDEVETSTPKHVKNLEYMNLSQSSRYRNEDECLYGRVRNKNFGFINKTIIPKKYLQKKNSLKNFVSVFKVQNLK